MIVEIGTMAHPPPRKATQSHAGRRRKVQLLILLPIGLTGLAIWHQYGLLCQLASSSSNGTTSNSPWDSWSPVLAAEADFPVKLPPDAPSYVWLASYPNSGTSYTMTMVERATNESTATHYGPEVTAPHHPSIPVHPAWPAGPSWEGLEGTLGHSIRHLPINKPILTKTHCGGRCLSCGSDEYVTDLATFTQACRRTTYTKSQTLTQPASGDSGDDNENDDEEHLKHVWQEGLVDLRLVQGVIHLMRHPVDNVVARFHLERRHLLQKGRITEDSLPRNATGFLQWCSHLDTQFDHSERIHSETVLKLMEQVPCRGEFYKYAQWHSRLLQLTNWLSQQNPKFQSLLVHYEDYEKRQEETVSSILDFLDATPISPVRPFRELPDYGDHLYEHHHKAVQALVKRVASQEAWQHMASYYYNDDADNQKEESSQE